MQLYKRISLLLTMGIMFIGLVTFSTGSPVAANSVELEENVSADKASIGNIAALSLQPAAERLVASPTPTPEPSPTSSPTPTPMPPNDLLEEEYPEINELITKYLNAKLECSLEAFEGIVTDTSYLDLEAMQKRTEAIKEYTDIKCYTKRGIGEVDLVVYYTYNMLIPTIDTPAAAIDSLYVSYNETGEPQVYYGEIASATNAYLKSLAEDDDVQSLVHASLEEMSAAIEADENLKAFWQKIQDVTDDNSEG